MGVSAFQGKKHRFTVLFHVIRHSVQSPGFRFVGVVGFARLRHRQRVHGGDVREARGEVRVTLDAHRNRLFLVTEKEQIGFFRRRCHAIHIARRARGVIVAALVFPHAVQERKIQSAKVGQALAVYADGDHLVFENCRFEGYQDTLFTAPLPMKEMQPGGFKGSKEFAPRRVGRHLYKNCYLAGNIDFIFGGGIAYFDGCEIFMKYRDDDELSGYVTAPSTFEGQKYGYVFNHCRFTSDCPESTAYLGRPWRNHAKAVVINSEIGPHIKKEGWHDWNKKDAWNTLFFAEYGNFGEGASQERAPFVTMLSKEEAEEYTIENVLGW